MDLDANKIIASFIGGLVSIAVAYLAYRGVKAQSSASKAASQQQSEQAQQDSAVKAWEGLLGPYREDVTRLRAEIKTVREESAAEVSDLRDDHQAAIDRLRAEVESLRSQVSRWRRLARANARIAARLRDVLVANGIPVETLSDDLLLVQETLDADP